MSGDILFNNARGEASTLQMAPPFAFSDVHMTVFPLQANLARLTQFCDSYLNQAGHIAAFKPFLPFVYLIILDYGRMSAPATQTGWVSQREVAFGVPLRWMEPGEDGAMVFKDFAFTTPFIFVDNELSLSTGREVYGWPKLLARLDPRVDEWIKDPHGARQVFEIRSRAAADRVGDDLKAPFLSVTQTPLTGLFDLPPNLKSATQAASAWPNALMGLTRMMREAGATIGELAMERARKADSVSDLFNLESVRKVLATDNPGKLLNPGQWADIGDFLRGMFPKMYSNTINLKQFRDAENPMKACYQAITAAKMPIVRFGGGGFLGTQNLMMGQIDGGYRVNIINTSTVPIVNHLGLIEAAQTEVDGGVLSSFAPVCPFWVEIDMVYDLGETLAMRTRSGNWTRPGEDNGDLGTLEHPIVAARKASAASTSKASKAADDSPKATSSDSRKTVPPEALRDPEQDDFDNFDDEFLTKDYYQIDASNPFNTSRGASEARGGVFRSKNTRVRVMPLLADPKVLDKFVDEYIQVDDHMRVKVWGRHVYMMATQHESISADMSPGQMGHANKVTFAIPVKLYDWNPNYRNGFPDTRRHPLSDDRRRALGEDRLIGTALITPFSYVDDITHAITESEVFGVPTLQSKIISPPDGWAAAQHQKGVLLETRAIVVPTLGAAAEGTRQTLIKVSNAPMVNPADTKAWSHVSGEWGNLLAGDMLQKADESGYAIDGLTTGWNTGFDWGRAMALRIMGGLQGVNFLGLKQFRDATQPANACYQGVVMRGTSIEKFHSLDEIDQDLTISVMRYPTQPIAETLGLIPKRTIVTEEGVCDEFEPVRPFELCADMVSSKGKTLFERVRGDEWKLINLPDGPLGWRPASRQEIRRARSPQYEDLPRPKISYVRYDEERTRHGRLKPLLLNDDEYRAFWADLRSRNVRDPKMLWRGIKLGTFLSYDVLQAMDDQRVDDIHSFVRTRGNLETAAEASEQGMDRVTELAGALELISPATILDTLLSRRWGASRDMHSPHDIRVQDFRIRRNAFGEALAEQLFPYRETQDGFWPISSEFAFDTGMWEATTENSLPHEFRKFVIVANESESDLTDVEEIAKNTLPEWFYEAAFNNNPVIDQIFPDEIPDEIAENFGIEGLADMEGLIGMLKQHAALIGIWPSDFRRQLHEGIDAFFGQAIAQIEDNGGSPSRDLEWYRRAWFRNTEMLMAEGAHDGLSGLSKLDIDSFLMATEFRSTPPTPGWLCTRIEMMVSNETLTLKDLKDRAAYWEAELRKRAS